MAATNIGSGTDKYPLAKMPAMSDAADIQIALKNYHYGQDAPLASGAVPTGGISKYLYDLETSIAGVVSVNNAQISLSTIDAKGDLLVGTGNDAVDNLAVGSPGYILSTNTGTATGLEWIAPVQLSDSTSTTSSTIAATSTAVKAAYDKASTAATTSVAGIVQLSDSTSETSSVKAATPTAVKAVADSKSALDFTILEKTADHPLVLSDAYKIIEMNLTSTANTVTIPLNATQAFPVGSQITIIQTGTGVTTVAVTAGVTLNCTPQVSSNAARLRAQYSSCTLIKRATNTWIAIGDLSA